MADKDTNWANAILDEEFGGQARSIPSSWYLQLTTTVPTASTPGTQLSSSVVGRLAVVRNQTNFPAASNGSIKNGVKLDFGTAGADAPANVKGVDFYDASTNGNRRRFGVLAAEKPITTGDPVYIAANGLTIQEA